MSFSYVNWMSLQHFWTKQCKYVSSLNDLHAFCIFLYIYDFLSRIERNHYNYMMYETLNAEEKERLKREKERTAKVWPAKVVGPRERVPLPTLWIKSHWWKWFSVMSTIWSGMWKQASWDDMNRMTNFPALIQKSTNLSVKTIVNWYTAPYFNTFITWVVFNCNKVTKLVTKLYLFSMFHY